MRISDWSSDVCSSDLAAWSRSGPRRGSPNGYPPEHAPVFHRHPGLDPGSRLTFRSQSMPQKAGSRIKSGMTKEGQCLHPIPKDRKSTRLNPVTHAQPVCRLLLEKKKHNTYNTHTRTPVY